MATMGEIITANPKFRKEAEKLGAKLDEYAEARIDGGASAASLYSFPQRQGLPDGYTRRDTVELNDRTLAFVHRVLWSVSSHVQDHKDRLFDKRNVLPEVLTSSFGIDHAAAIYSAKQFSKQLAYTGRAHYIGKPRRGQVRMWIVDPDSKEFRSVDGWTSSWNPSARAKAEIEQQARKAEELAGEVSVTIDLSKIPTPDPTPESVMQYIARMTAAAHKMEEQVKTLSRRLDEANEQNEELLAKLAETEKSEEAAKWGSVVDMIEATKGGTG